MLPNLSFADLGLPAFSFAHPWALLLLLALPFWWWRRRRFQPAAIPFSRLSALVRGPRLPSWAPRALFLLRNAALIGLTIAVAGPRSGGQVDTSDNEGINIVIAFDISSSMLAEDFQPNNRLEVARAKTKQFVGLRKSDRVGLVAFSGEALTQVPLTTDHAVVQSAVDNLQPGQLEDGTAIGTAIATAANRLRTAPGASRVMVLMTDGVNNRGSIDPRTAAQAAAAFGVRIYAIGVGSRGMASVPVGRGLFGLRYENRPVEIDDSLLTDVARGTGGRYFRATTAESLDEITREIDRLERAPVQVRQFIRYRELYRWPLTFAMLCLLGELALAIRREALP